MRHLFCGNAFPHVERKGEWRCLHALLSACNKTSDSPLSATPAKLLIKITWNVTAICLKYGPLRFVWSLYNDTPLCLDWRPPCAVLSSFSETSLYLEWNPPCVMLSPFYEIAFIWSGVPPVLCCVVSLYCDSPLFGM